VATWLRSVRPLTYAAFIPALLTLLALPFGLVEPFVSNLAALYGLYFALPAVLAWCLDRIRGRLPRFAQRLLGVLILAVAVPTAAVFLVWTALVWGLGVPPAAVVFIVALRLLRARPPGGRVVSTPVSGTPQPSTDG
jgi:hypothetical protein